MAENDGHDGFWRFLRQVLTDTKGLPALLRVVVILLLLVVALVWLGKAEPSDLTRNVSSLVHIALGGYLVLEGMRVYFGFKERTALAATPAPPAPPPVDPVPPVRPDSLATPDDLRAAYCYRLFLECRGFSLQAIDLGAQNRPAAELELSEVFTSLDVMAAQGDLVREEEHRRIRDVKERMIDGVGLERFRLSAVAALSEQSKLVLLGDPGSGKSTLASFITLCLAGDWLGHDKVNVSALGEGWALPRLLPVRVALRDYVAEGLLSGKGIWDFIQGTLARSAPGSPDLTAFAPSLEEALKQSNGGLLILDGLDEVPEANRMREQLKQAVLGFCETFRECRVLVTTRPYAYQNEEWRLPGFDVRRLAEFSEEQIDTFIEKWYAHIRVKEPSLTGERAKLYTKQLKAVIAENARVRELAPRPLLLTLMASLHWSRGGGALPEKREELYDESVKLLLDRWQRPKLRFDSQGQLLEGEFNTLTELGISQDGLRAALTKVAYDVHREQDEPRGAADIGVARLAGALYEASERRESIRISDVTDYVTDRAGLLIERRQGEQYAFAHRTFQEYLAACFLADADYPYLIEKHVREDDERWREVALLAASKAAGGSVSSIWRLVEVFCKNALPSHPKPHDGVWYAALRAAQALIEARQHQHVPEREQRVFERLRARVEKLCIKGALSPADRADAGRALAALGDRRPGVGLGDEGLPDIQWCTVPSGTLMMGSSKDDQDAYESEYGANGKPFPVEMDSFRLAVYPTTNAQFRPFVESDGYTNREYWCEAGWAWREGEEAKEPLYWSDDDYRQPNHPVVGMSWYEACAYCEWLTACLRQLGELDEGQCVRLPTEAEWEWAARGRDAQKYPWGSEWGEDRCNSTDAGIGRACAVGLFPTGVSQWLSDVGEAPHDMVGNVFDWCHDWYGEYPKETQTGPSGPERGSLRVVRGGCFYGDAGYCRSACRRGYDPGYRFYDVGLRPARSLP